MLNTQAQPVPLIGPVLAGKMPAEINEWNVEDAAFWEATGKPIAYRNLWISVPALLCGFAVWGMWGIITVQMMNGVSAPPARWSTSPAQSARWGSSG